MSSLDHEALERVLGAATGARVSIGEIGRLSGGASRETWRVGFTGEDGSVATYILQRATVSAEDSEKDVGAEAQVIEAAIDVGVDVPDLVAHSATDDPLGRPFLLSSEVHGESIARRIQRDDAYSVARSRFASQCGRQLGLIHSIPVTDVPRLVAQDQLDRYREVLAELGQPHPTLELAMRWLETNRTQPARQCVVHGDFRLGNLLVGEDGVRAVVDWELAHLGDPMEDLGWLCTKAWRFGGEEPVGGIGRIEELIETYEIASGAMVDRDALRWWTMLGSFKWAVICILQAARHLSGATRSHELAAIGRRVCENEWDLLELLGQAGSA